MNKPKWIIVITLIAMAVFATRQVVSFNKEKADLPRVHTARSCDDCSFLKVRVSNHQVSEIAGRAFYVKPVDTFDWKNKCQGTQGQTIVYEPSDSKSGIPVKLCDL